MGRMPLEIKRNGVTLKKSALFLFFVQYSVTDRKRNVRMFFEVFAARLTIFFICDTIH